MAAQVALSGDDHVIQAFAPDRANHAFDVGALPGRAGCRQHLRHPTRRDLIHEVATEDTVPVPQQIARCRFSRKGFAELLSGPCSRGVSGHAEMKNPAAVMRQHEEHVQDLEADRRTVKESIDTVVVR